MGWFSSLRSKISARSAEMTLHDVERNTSKTMQPLADLAVALVCESWQCTQFIESHVPRPSDIEDPKHFKEAYIFFEILSFSMFLAAKQAFMSALSRTTWLTLKEILILMIVPPQVDTFFADRPDKPELAKHLHFALSDADFNYAQSDKGASYGLARNVLTLAGHDLTADSSKSNELVALVEKQLMENLSAGKLGLDSIRGLVEHAAASIKDRDRATILQGIRAYAVDGVKTHLEARYEIDGPA